MNKTQNPHHSAIAALDCYANSFQHFEKYPVYWDKSSSRLVLGPKNKLQIWLLYFNVIGLMAVFGSGCTIYTIVEDLNMESNNASISIWMIGYRIVMCFFGIVCFPLAIFFLIHHRQTAVETFNSGLHLYETLCKGN
jgi:hypothetical protein